MGSSLNFTVSLINHTVCHHKQFCLSSVNSSPLSERPLPLSARRWRPLRRRRLLLPFSSARPSNRDWQSPSSPLSPQEREKRLLLSFPVGVGPFRFLKNYNSDSLGVFMRSKNRFLWMSRDSQFLFWGNWLTSRFPPRKTAKTADEAPLFRGRGRCEVLFPARCLRAKHKLHGISGYSHDWGGKGWTSIDGDTLIDSCDFVVCWYNFE